MDGTNLPAIPDHDGNVLVAYALDLNDLGVGLRAYAIDSRSMSVVSSQVYAYADSTTHSMTTRSVEFSCEFYFDQILDATELGERRKSGSGE